MATPRGPENQNKWPDYVKNQRDLSDSRVAILTGGSSIPEKVRKEFKLKNRRRD